MSLWPFLIQVIIIPRPFPSCVFFPPASHVSPSNSLIVFSDCSLSCLFLVSVLASIRYFLACISAFHFHSLMFLISCSQVKLSYLLSVLLEFFHSPSLILGLYSISSSNTSSLSPTPFWCLSLNIFS